MNKGKFWPPVRAMIWDKAQQMFQEEQARTMSEDWKATTPERKELREAGYFHTAKLLVLREIYEPKRKKNGHF